MKPLEISEFSDLALMILWEDGHESLYIYEDLRRACPCAVCADAREKPLPKLGLRRMIPIQTSSDGIKPLDMERVGRYALKFVWSDGHSTGIYSFELLRRLCPCNECQPPKG
ncbi:MAG: DUF971 domain-containing protein [Deltaproteobacteria bacterium]